MEHERNVTALEHLALRYYNDLNSGVVPDSSASGDLAMDCLRLSPSARYTGSTRSREIVEFILTQTSPKFDKWFEKLPWRLSRNRMSESWSDREAESLLIANLNHHNSGIRLWICETCWFALPLHETTSAIQPLLRNIADTILHWDVSAALIAKLLPLPPDRNCTLDSFVYRCTDGERSESFQTQFQERIEATHNDRWQSCFDHILEVQRRVENLIIQAKDRAMEI